MNDNMEVNGKAVPKVHRPPSLIFRDEGNPALGRLNNPGIFKCIDYRRLERGDLFYNPAEDGVFDSNTEWDGFHGSYPLFPRVIVERIQEREIEPTEGHA